MKDYRTINMVGTGEFVSGITGSNTDFDVTLDDGTVLETYNPDHADKLFPDDPAAGGLLVFGLRTDSRAVVTANADFIPATMAALFFDRKDLS